MDLKSGHKMVPITGDELEEIKSDFYVSKKGMARIYPGGWYLPMAFGNIADSIYEFKFKPTDIVVSTYPKCGTTWTQEIVWTLTNNINFDNPSAGQSIFTRSPFIEFDCLVNDPNDLPMEVLEKMAGYILPLFPDIDLNKPLFLQIPQFIPNPRVIKTHLPFSLMPPDMLDTCKVIYVVRNPKDACVSYSHHQRLIKGHNYTNTFEKFVKYFMDDKVYHSPYWLNVKEGYERRNHRNMHFMYFEEMKANPLSEITRLSDFLGLGLTQEKLKEVTEYTSFKAMKERDVMFPPELFDSTLFNVEVKEKSGGFFRKGVTGDWKSKISGDLEKQMDEWIEKNSKDIGINFKY